nr:ATP-binding protein [Rhizobium rhizoryzae]
MAHELTVSYQAAEAGNRAKSQFMATMGHEIRTPLNAILGMVELLELNKLPEDALSRVRAIRRSGEALLDIINEILDYAKIEHGKLELEERPVDLVTLAENSAEMMRGRATEAGTRISVDLPHRWHARHVLADPTRLRQVMLNLMSNAVKFTSEGTVTLRMRQQVRQSGVWLRVEVQDTGIGIGEEGRKKLFRPFSQVDASISRRYGGTGLGLTICKEIIDRFGGRIGVDSAPGFGSTFWFEVPVQATEAPATEQDVETPNVFARIAPLRILLAEDNKINQQVILGYLGHLGQAAAVAENGQVALELASRQDFDLVLMDMQMPIMDGIEATRRLREPESRNRNVPIIALTANASEEDRRLCRDAGMTGFQAKPISLAALHALLQDVIPMSSTEPERPAVDTISDNHSQEPRSGIAAVADRRKEIEDILGADAFEELMAAFFDDAVDLLNSLNVSMQDGRKENFDTLLHNLKGAAANIGLEEIAMQAQTLRKRELTLSDIDELSQQIRAAQTALAA